MPYNMNNKKNIRTMKKRYITPTIEVYAMHPHAMLLDNVSVPVERSSDAVDSDNSSKAKASSIWDLEW